MHYFVGHAERERWRRVGGTVGMAVGPAWPTYQKAHKRVELVVALLYQMVMMDFRNVASVTTENLSVGITIQVTSTSHMILNYITPSIPRVRGCTIIAANL